MPVSRPRRSSLCAALFTGAAVLSAWSTSAIAQQVSREEDITELRLGQKVLVDDGSCPNGQIKEVTGATLTEAGVARTRKCVPRLQRR